jgi:YgiT-type zinc finger domain-containing protein
MKCPVCKNGKMEQKTIDYQTKNKNDFIIVKNVLANVCDVCGEAFLEYHTVKKIEEVVNNNTQPVGHIEVAVYDLVV